MDSYLSRGIHISTDKVFCGDFILSLIIQLGICDIESDAEMLAEALPISVPAIVILVE
jgi:hypothetical protein